LPRTAAMEPESSQRIKISKEGDFNSLLGALIRELPDVFEAEVLSKLSVKDHLTLAQVNKECKDFVYRLEPLEFMRMCRYYYDDHTYLRAALQRIDKAVEIGRLDVLKWLWERKPSWRKFVLRTVYNAGRHGQKEVLDWFYTLPREDFPRDGLTEHSFSFEHGLTEHQIKEFPYQALSGAARGGHLELVKHLREKGWEWDDRICAAAAQEGHVHVLEYLRTNGCPWSSVAGYRAAEGNQLDTLKWLREHRCPWDEYTMVHAAAAGKFASLKWLHEHGCPGWDADLFSTAVNGGSLKMLMWMHENGCPWDEEATEYAALDDDHLEILKWLHKNGCPISDEACWGAEVNDAWTCLQYLVDNKCPNWEDYVNKIPKWFNRRECEWLKQKQTFRRL
jgi:hypothetical protein